MRHEFDLDGKRVVAHAQWTRGQLWVWLNGKTLVIEDPAQNRASRSRGGGAGQAGDVLAPMPGKVTKILRQAGDTVAKGDAVLVMEAMKMEYTLKAAGPGHIEAVQCQVGEQVTLGKVLAKITPAAEA